MNWRRIDECWKNFADSQGSKIDILEHRFVYGTRTTYKLILNSSQIEIVFIGDIKKSTSGYNHYRTDIIISPIDLARFKFEEVKDRRVLGLFKRDYQNSEQSYLLKELRAYNGKWLRLKNSRLEIRFDWTFDQTSDFLKTLELADKIITAADNRVDGREQ